MTTKARALAQYMTDVEFGTVFTVYPDGTWSLTPELYAPEVNNDPGADVYVADMAGDRWEALAGMTGQYGYNGAVMHPSELPGEGMAQRLLDIAADEERPVSFALQTAWDADTDTDIGWAVLQSVQEGS